MKIWLITDTHFGHKKLIDWGRPPDFEEQLLKNLNRMVQPGDMLIHLGDICIGDDEGWHLTLMRDVLPQSVKKVLLLGNHDSKSISWYIDHGWDFVCNNFMLEWGGKSIVFSHRPLLFSRKTEDINVHGHTHGNTHRDHEHEGLYDLNYHKELAVENTGYKPVRLDHFLFS